MNLSSFQNQGPTACAGTVPRIIRLLTVLLAALLLQACSAIKLAYNNAPEFAYWWLDGYVDFSDEQSLLVRRELASLQQWHRTRELPRIAELLQKAQRMASGEISTASVCAMFGETRERLFALSMQAEPAVLALAPTLNPAQLAHIERKFDKVNAEWRDEWLNVTAAERYARRLKNNLERSEQFYGKLDERQVAVLRARLEASVFDPVVSYAERLRRQQDLLQTLRAHALASPRPPASAMLVALRAYLERADNSPNPAYRNYSARLVQEGCQTFTDVHNSTTAAQRERAVRRLAAYERDVLELRSAQP